MGDTVAPGWMSVPSFRLRVTAVMASIMMEVISALVSLTAGFNAAKVNEKV